MADSLFSRKILPPRGQLERMAAERAREMILWWRANNVEIADAMAMLGAPGDVRTWQRAEEHAKAVWLLDVLL